MPYSRCLRCRWIESVQSLSKVCPPFQRSILSTCENKKETVARDGVRTRGGSDSGSSGRFQGSRTTTRILGGGAAVVGIVEWVENTVPRTLRRIEAGAVTLIAFLYALAVMSAIDQFTGTAAPSRIP
jgi:hypothetical protein